MLTFIEIDRFYKYKINWISVKLLGPCAGFYHTPSAASSMDSNQINNQIRRKKRNKILKYIYISWELIGRWPTKEWGGKRIEKKSENLISNWILVNDECGFQTKYEHWTSKTIKYNMITVCSKFKEKIVQYLWSDSKCFDLCIDFPIGFDVIDRFITCFFFFSDFE